MLISIEEIFYLIILTVAIGYIFSGIIKRQEGFSFGFNWKDLKYAAIVAAPGIILHEMGHKFVAMALGLNAKFFIWPTGLLIGVVLKALNTGFLLVAPGYVSIVGANDLQTFLTALAGPVMNLILWIGTILVLKYKKNITRNQATFLIFTKEINKWLFIFNMIPIPPLDGSKIFSSLYRLLF